MLICKYCKLPIDNHTYMSLKLCKDAWDSVQRAALNRQHYEKQHELLKKEMGIPKPIVHKPECKAYGNYQPPYEECTCGAEK